MPDLEVGWTTWRAFWSGFREIEFGWDRLESVGFLAPFLAHLLCLAVRRVISSLGGCRGRWCPLGLIVFRALASLKAVCASVKPAAFRSTSGADSTRLSMAGSWTSSISSRALSSRSSCSSSSEGNRTRPLHNLSYEADEVFRRGRRNPGLHRVTLTAQIPRSKGEWRVGAWHRLLLA